MWMNCEYELRWKHASSDMWFTSSKHLNDEPQRSKHSFFLFFFFFPLPFFVSLSSGAAPGGSRKGPDRTAVVFSRSVLPAWQTIKATHVPGRYTGDMMFWAASFFSRFRQTRTLCSVSVRTSEGTWNLFSVVIPSQARAGSWWCGVTHRHRE